MNDLLLTSTAILLAAASATARPQPSTAPASGEEKVAVVFRWLGTDPDGATTSGGSKGLSLAPGSSGCIKIGVGFVGEDGLRRDNLCPMFFGGCGDPVDPHVGHVWEADVRAVPAPVGRVALEVDWEHLEATRPGDYRRAGGGMRTLEMDEGEHHVLDLLRVPDGLEPRCAVNGLLRLETEIREDPRLRDRRLGYDLWLVHTAPDGAEMRRHLELAGTQGKEIPLRFHPLRWPVPGRYLLSDDPGFEVLVDISGSVQGRSRADGTIELDLDLMRHHRVVHAGWMPGATGEAFARERSSTTVSRSAGDAESRSVHEGRSPGGVGMGGRKRFTVRPGETVALELPDQAQGSHGWEGKVRVPFEEFFAGHGDRILLTVRRLDGPTR